MPTTCPREQTPTQQHPPQQVVAGIAQSTQSTQYTQYLAVALRALLLDDVEYGHAHGTRDRVAAERVEVQGLAQHLGDGRRGDDSRHGEAVADTLGHGHDVGPHAMALEPPEVIAGAAEARLHLGSENVITLRAGIMLKITYSWVLIFVFVLERFHLLKKQRYCMWKVWRLICRTTCELSRPSRELASSAMQTPPLIRTSS